MKKFFMIFILLVILPINVNAKKGCCSWHGGVSHCGDNGKYVCNDGTDSPSCTCTPSITYKYGCTNRDAINYDSLANRDDGSCIYKIYGCMNINAINYNDAANISDGSCQFEEEITEEVEIPYEVITEKGKENIIKQKGSKGKKKIITKNIKNELGDIISSDSFEEIILEPVNEIKIVEEKISEKDNEEDGGLVVGFIFFISALIFGIYKIKKTN